jgi:hypothetical protein
MASSSSPRAGAPPAAAVHKEGWLTKAPMSVGSKGASGLLGAAKKSHKRFFVLDGAKLSYFDKAGGACKGCVELSSESIVRAGAGGASLVVTPFLGSAKELLLQAADSSEAGEWMEALLIARELGVAGGASSSSSSSAAGASSAGAEGKEDESGSEDESKSQERRGSGSYKPRASSASSAGDWEGHLQSARRTRLPHLEYDTIKEGYLDKQSSQVGALWNRRWFCLTNALEYWDSEEARKAGGEARAITLEAVIASKSPLPDAPNDLVVYTIGGSYTLRAASPEDAADWIDKLNSCHKRLRRKSDQSADGDRPRARTVSTEDKVVPDWLEGIKDKTVKPKMPENLHEPPPALGDDGHHGAASEAGGEGDAGEGDAGAGASASASASAAQAAVDAPNPPAEDKFAKLRALKAARAAEAEQ